MPKRTCSLGLILTLLAGCDSPAEIERFVAATRHLDLKVKEMESLSGFTRMADAQKMNLERLEYLAPFTDAASFLSNARKPPEGIQTHLEVVGTPDARGSSFRWKARGPMNNHREFTSGPNGLEVIDSAFVVVEQLTLDTSGWTAEGKAFPSEAPCNHPRWLHNDGATLSAQHLRAEATLLESSERKKARTALLEARRRLAEARQQLGEAGLAYLTTEQCLRAQLHLIQWIGKQPNALWIGYRMFGKGYVYRTPFVGTIRAAEDKVVFEGTRPKEVRESDIAEKLPAGWSVLESQPGGRIVFGRAEQSGK